MKQTYKDQMDWKRHEWELEKIKDQQYANEYNKANENFFKKHDDLVSSQHQRNSKLLESQFNTVIEDANNDKKRAAVENMRRTFEWE